MHKDSKNIKFNDGFMKLNKELDEMMKWADESRIKDAQEAGASFLVDKVRKLSKPRRTGKTLEGVDYEYNSTTKGTDVGWGDYHGRIVEGGHHAGPRNSRSKKKKSKDTRTYVAAQPHLFSTYKNNKEKIYEIMIKKIRGGK